MFLLSALSERVLRRGGKAKLPLFTVDLKLPSKRKQKIFLEYSVKKVFNENSRAVLMLNRCIIF